MRQIKIKKSYKKDLKRAVSNPRQDTARLNAAIAELAIQGGLPPDFLPHPLSGNWRPSWECHIQPDFLLVYQIDDDTLTLIRCGTHSELFRK